MSILKSYSILETTLEMVIYTNVNHTKTVTMTITDGYMV